MGTGLITSNITPAIIFVPTGLDPLITGVNEKVKKFQEQNLTTEKAKDRDKIRSFAAKISKTKKFIDEARIEFVRDRKASLKLIDQEGKNFRDTLDEIRDKVRQPLTKWEAAEKDRVEKEKKLEIFNTEHQTALAENDIFDREKELTEREAMARKLEDEKREKEEAERTKKEQIERDVRLKKEAAEEATKIAAEKITDALRKEKETAEELVQAEKNRIKAQEQAEQDKRIAIQKAKDAFERNARIEKEEIERKSSALKKAVEAKAANKKHQAAINNKALSDLLLISNISKDLGKKIIMAIIKKQIEGISINY